MTVSPPSPPLRGLRALFANRGYRFALSWVVLVVMFVVFFQWFGRGSDQAGTVVPGPLRVLSSYFFLLPVAGVFGFLYLRMRRACAVNNRGLALMADGDLSGAVRCAHRRSGQRAGVGRGGPTARCEPFRCEPRPSRGRGCDSMPPLRFLGCGSPSPGALGRDRAQCHRRLRTRLPSDQGLCDRHRRRS